MLPEKLRELRDGRCTSDTRPLLPVGRKQAER